MRRVGIIVVLALVLSLFSGVRADGNHSVSGTVYDISNNQPLEGACVQLSKIEGGQTHSTVTDENGNWELVVPSGRYYLTVWKDNYTYYTAYYEIERDISVTIYLMQLDSAWMNWVENQIWGIQENIGEIREEIAEIWEGIAFQSYEINSLKQRVENLENRMDQLENKVSRIEENLDLVWRELKATENLLTEMIERITELEQEVTDLQSRVADLEIRVSNLEVQVYNIWLKIAEIERKITVPEGIPRFSISGRVFRMCENLSEPYPDVYVWIGSYNLVPMDTYTDLSGGFEFENVVGDRVVLRVKDLRYEWILNKDAELWIYYSLSENRTFVVSPCVYGSIYLGENLYENQVEVTLVGVNVDRVYSDNFTKTYQFQNVEVGEYTLIAKAGDLKFVKELVVTHEPLKQDIALQKAVGGAWWIMPLVGGILLTTFVGAMIVGAKAVRRR